eukprot:8227253-Pyramimonas_sp.AAC.2
MVALPAEAATKKQLHALEETAERLFEAGNCTEVEVGNAFTPSNSKCYELHFGSHIGNDTLRNDIGGPALLAMVYDLDSTFFLTTDSVAHVAIFTNHPPTEFERSQHYLRTSSTGEDVEPVAEKEPSDNGTEPWGKALGAAVLVNLVTLAGLVLAIPAVHTGIRLYPVTFTVVGNGFASGTLLSAAFFLLLYEATHLIPIGDSEAQAAGEWGSMILLGFIASSVVELITSSLISINDGLNSFSRAMGTDCGAVCSNGCSDELQEMEREPKLANKE